MKLIVICCLVQLLNVTPCYCARILGIFPTPSISHQVVYRALMEALAERGHHLVVMTTDPVNYKEPAYENLTQIDVHNISYSLFHKLFNFAQVRQDDKSPMSLVSIFYESMNYITDIQLQTPEMQKIIHDPKEHFDLCFFEAFVSVIVAFKDRFNCSMITISSFGGLIQNYDAVGNPAHPLYYRDVFIPYSGEINIWQKIHLIYLNVYYKYIYYVKLLPQSNAVVKKHFGLNVRSVDIIDQDMDMLFLNSYKLYDDVRPTVPAVVHLGSMHIKPPKKLPKNLQSLMDTADRGVIYFSLGSNVKSNQLPAETRAIFLEAFREMPYLILWKWENDTLPDKPDNVFISKWMPQNDLFAHPNLKAFISQVGQQSMEEAIHYSIPIIGIPFIADQEMNAKKLVRYGIGKHLHIETLDKEHLKESVKAVIEEPSYRENIINLREMMYDQPQSSVERAVWWTEYVLRHKGARHLRSPGAGAPLYQYLMLDILAVLLAALALSVILAKFLWKTTLNYLSKRLHGKMKMK